jgi:hypothetical protein
VIPGAAIPPPVIPATVIPATVIPATVIPERIVIARRKAWCRGDERGWVSGTIGPRPADVMTAGRRTP